MLHSSYRQWTLSTAIAKVLIAGVLLNSLTPHANTAVAQGPRLGEVCSGISRHFLENNYYDDVNIFGNLWRKPVKGKIRISLDQTTMHNHIYSHYSFK